jgi:nitrogen regulation protein NR(I)
VNFNIDQTSIMGQPSPSFCPRRMSKPSVLIIDDDQGIAAGLRRVLSNEGYDVTVVESGDEGWSKASAQEFNAVVTDLKMPGLSGLELVQALHQAKPHLPIILMTAHGTTETAINATKLGAFDYLLKPFEMEELIDLIGKAVNSNRLTSEPVQIGEAATAGEAIVGKSRAMQEIYKEIGRVAPSPVTVLIRGETGTGKELIARAIYQHSDRANQPFIAVNCAAIPETLLESELFGHERGAFTGAEARRIGRFEQADKGTIFLDEVGEMSQSTQAKLLRVLQEKTIQRLGAKETIHVDLRVIAATHRDLEQAIVEKTFREDLYYRLSVVVLKLPPLRGRTEDIPALVNYLLKHESQQLGVTSPSMQNECFKILQEYPWPGNVRELQNLVRQIILTSRGYTITEKMVSQALSRLAKPSTASPAATLSEVVAEMIEQAKTGQLQNIHSELQRLAEQELFTQAIRAANGNQAQAARWLGISRLTMREKLTQFGIHPSMNRE